MVEHRDYWPVARSFLSCNECMIPLTDDLSCCLVVATMSLAYMLAGMGVQGGCNIIMHAVPWVQHADVCKIGLQHVL